MKEHSFLVAVGEAAELIEKVLCGYNKFLASNSANGGQSLL